jgi:hypothetical protein
LNNISDLDDLDLVYGFDQFFLDPVFGSAHTL